MEQSLAAIVLNAMPVMALALSVVLLPLVLEPPVQRMRPARQPVRQPARSTVRRHH